MKALTALAAIPAVIFALPAPAQRTEPVQLSAAPPCTGRDIWAGLKDSDPVSYARILDEAKAVPNAGAILWRIEGNGRPTSYLFGTIHITDDRVHALSPAIREALAGSKRLALEVEDLSPDAVNAALAKTGHLVTYEGAQSLKTQLPPADYEAVNLALRRYGLPEEVTVRMKPWVLGLMLALPPCEGTRVAAGLKSLDERLADEAKSRGVPVVGLETLEEQLRSMAGLPDDVQTTFLVATVKMFDRPEDSFETIIRRYVGRELAVVWPMQLVLAEKIGVPRAPLDLFEKQMIVERNRRMRDAALPYLRDGGLFIGVGALHLPGREGLVEMLREAGYKLTAVE
ncbi:MAG: TraB/GumN family protein [Hyphomicrobiaceae bacterium]